MLQQILIMIFLVIMSAYFSATETAFSSANKTRLKTLVEAGNKKARTTLALAEDYDKLISTILIGNNIVNIALASIGTILFVNLYGDIGATISTVVITIVVLVFGEISPKSIAKDVPERFAMFSTPIIRCFIWVLTPLNLVFAQWKKLLAKVIKTDANNKISQEELLMLVDEVQQEGSLDEDDGELIKNAIEFKELEARDILTPRVDLEAVSIDAEKSEIAEKFAQTGFSRLFVYNDSIDKIIGFIHLKDFYSARGVNEKDISELIVKPLFIQKSEKINDLLKLLQKNKSHVAVVIDEYGGTLGIVTMEDILEELVGEIWDEHDEVVETFKKIDDDIYQVDGLVAFDDFCEFFEINDETENVTVGGWVVEKIGWMPQANDSFELENLKIIITNTDSRRVETIKVIVNGEKDDE